MKNVLVTGAAGFLGSHLAKHHLDAGDRVHGFDDFCSSDPGSAHLADLRSYESFTLQVCSITDIQMRDHAMAWANKNGDVDLIYNFACPASPPRYQDMPIHTMLTCVAGTENMLKVAEDFNAVLVHASTSEVYGDPDTSPQPESYRGCVNSYGPRACYDEGKRAAEALCYDYLNSYNVDARLVRIFNTYGPNMDPYDGRVVSNFIRQALKREPLTVYGHGQQTRSFCYVDDLIRGIVALGTLESNPATPVNLGNPDEFKVIELAEKVARKLCDGKLVRGNHSMPADDPRQRCPDISRAQQLLGWEPKVTLDEGLDRTIEYLRSVVR
jgi:UDP-glucuronate decarboxylase